MAYSWSLQGSIVVEPVLGVDTGAPTNNVPIDENVQLSNRIDPQYSLTDDTTIAVNFGPLTAVNVIQMKVIGAKVKIRLTSADGTTQAIPVDSVFILTDLSVPITAIDLTRALGGVETTVILFLGQV